MSDRSTLCRMAAEINFGEEEPVGFKIGSRSIHQYWHLFASQTRSVLLAPQRRPDSGRVAWHWREEEDSPPATTAELVDVRRRLSEASRQLMDEGLGATDSQLDRQVHGCVREMIAQLMGKGDQLLGGFVCRAESGLMLHSWGAESPARPQCLDDQASEVSGTVWIGDRRAPKIAVVIETEAGTVIARSDSDRDGGFSFQAVPPGNYRVRVADRTDFPAGGVPFNLEREAVGGLELRGGVQSRTPALSPPLSSSAGARTSRRQWAALTVCVPAILGVAFCLWRPNRQANLAVGSANQSAWQTARGKLASADIPPVATDSQAGSGEPGWSELSRSIPTAKKLPGPHEPHAGSTPLPDNGSPAEPPSDAGVSGAPQSSGSSATPADLKSGQPESKGERPPVRGFAAVSVNPDNSGTRDDGKDSADESEPSSPAPAGGQPKKSSSVTRGGKSQTSSDAGRSGEVTSGAEEASAGSAAGKTAATTASAATPIAGKSGRPARAPSVAGAGSAEPSSAESAEVIPAGLADPASPPSAPATPTGHSNAPAGSGQKKRNGNLAASAGPAAADATAGNAVAEAATPNLETSLAKKTPGISPPRKNKSMPAAVAATAPLDDTNPDSNSPESENQPLAQTPANAKVTAKSTFRATAPSASAVKNQDADTPHTGADDDAEPEKSAAAAQGSGKNSGVPKTAAAARPPAPADESSDLGAAIASSPGSPGSESSASSRATLPSVNGEVLDTMAQVSASAWKVRLVQDVIIPTTAVLAGEETGLDALRTKLWQESRAQIPPAFRQPVISSGFVFEFAPEASPLDKPSWRDAIGVEIQGATVTGNQAEFGWPVAGIPSGHEYILRGSDHQMLARVGFDPAGVPVVKVAAGVRAWYWLGIENLPADGAATAQFEWRVLDGTKIPRAWRRIDQWKNGRGRRLEVPLEKQSARKTDLPLALVDEPTGWALTSLVRVH